MKKIIILIPVYNDWQSVTKLLEKIDLEIMGWEAEVKVMIMNDASTDERSKSKFICKNIKSIWVKNMKKNVGHSRCVATGLKFINEKIIDYDYVMLMDGDGEDRPEELSLLFSKSKENSLKTVTGNRIKRTEGLFFRFLYECHKLITYIFTGKHIKFGNFSIVPQEHIIRLLQEGSIWSSFSGSLVKVIKEKYERVSIPSIKGLRYFDQSKMSYFDLFLHSFAIIAVFKTSVIVRSILFVVFYLFLISSNISIITLLPILAILIFVFLIIKVSDRENIEGLNNSLKNIDEYDSDNIIS